MKRGPIIHGVLLLAMLIFAYQTWTREEEKEPKIGKVDVWAKEKGQLTAILFETKDRTVRIEQRTEGGQTYLWGQETRVTRKRKPPAKNEPTPEDSTEEPPSPEASAEEPTKPKEPEEEITTKKREFPVGDSAEEVWDYFKDLKALRDLGELDDEDRKKYGVAESTDNITAVFSDGERSLILGGKIYGSQDRYVLETQSNHGYAMAGAVLRSLYSGETSLRVRKLHKYEPDDVAKARVSTPDGGERNLVRITVPGAKVDTKTWADAETTDKPDQTMANFLAEVEKLRPTRYFTDIDPKTLTPLLIVEYQGKKGDALGRLEVYKKAEEPSSEAEGVDGEGPGEADEPDAEAGDEPPTEPGATPDEGSSAKAEKDKPKKQKAEYYLRTERTRVLGEFSDRQGERLESDLAQIFAK